MEYRFSEDYIFICNETINQVKCKEVTLYPWDQQYKLALLVLFEQEMIPVEVIKAMPVSELLEFVLFEYRSDYWSNLCLKFIQQHQEHILIHAETYAKVATIKNDKRFSQELRHNLSHVLGRIW